MVRVVNALDIIIIIAIQPLLLVTIMWIKLICIHGSIRTDMHILALDQQTSTDLSLL